MFSESLFVHRDVSIATNVKSAAQGWKKTNSRLLYELDDGFNHLFKAISSLSGDNSPIHQHLSIDSESSWKVI